MSNFALLNSQVIQERRKQKSKGSYAPMKKDLLDLLMDMYDEETDSRMDDDELRSQVCLENLGLFLAIPLSSERSAAPKVTLIFGPF